MCYQILSPSTRLGADIYQCSTIGLWHCIVHGHGIVCYKRYGSYCAKDLEFTVSFSSCCCSPGTDIKLWAADSGKCIGMVDTNQLKNTMAALSPNGRFLAAAAFTADVKVWNGSVHSLPSVWVLFLVILLCPGDL